MQRLNTILDDTDAKIVLASPQHQALLENHDLQVLGVDAAFLERCPTSDQFLEPSVQPADPAFVIYTSGSTGTPKGVVLEHAALATSDRSIAASHGLTPETRAIQFAAYTFDVSISDTICTLLHGGTVCVISEDERMNDLPGAISARRANFVHLTPTVAGLLDPDSVPGVKTLCIGGEPMTAKVVDIWANRALLINSYGPAECSIDSTFTIVDSKMPITNVGKAASCLIWIVDQNDHNRLVPIGCTGEILVEGYILAREYLNDPIKTNAAFVTNIAWLDSKSRRLYKTGDLGRYSADMSVELLGRKDQQVKLNGQRIELGEIEHQIRKASSNIVDVVVEMVAPAARGSRASIAAFLKFEDTRLFSEPRINARFLFPETTEGRDLLVEIKSRIERTLNSYMVPSLYLPLRALPTSASGKVNWKQLRSLVDDLSIEDLSVFSLATGSKQAPATRMELQLQKLWSEVLRISSEMIFAQDNFFQIGGESIRSMQLTSTARSVGINISVADIFKNPRLCDMARFADREQQAVSLREFPAPFSMCSNFNTGIADEIAKQCGINPKAVEDVYPCTPLQEGLMSITSRQPEAYVAQLSLKIPQTIDISKFKAAWAALVFHNPILRTRIVIGQSGNSMQVVVKGDINWKSGASLDLYLEQDSQLEISYGTPLSRFAIISDSDHGTVFVLTAHHALYDGWSLNAFIYRPPSTCRPSGY
jgi:amino acid adenylation domain-containing protein